MRETSLATYRDLEASGALSRLRLLVAKDVAEHGPTTQAETTLRLRASDGAATYVDSYQPRFAELEEMGVIQATGERVCQVTGHGCLEWDLTGRMPTKREKKPTRVEAERERCRQLALRVAQIAQTEQGRRAAEEVARMIARKAGEG